VENESLQGKKIIMSLGQKTLVILFLTVIGLTGILHVATRILLLRKFAALEERETRNAVERAQNAINDAIETLSATTNDYGAWDKTYAFMEHPAALASMQQEFKNEALQGLHINSVLIMDPAGTVAFFKAFDSSLKLERNFAKLKELLAADSWVKQVGTSSTPASGVLVLFGRPTLIAACPILTSERKGAIARRAGDDARSGWAIR
jgi:sensor domain CHASE-containing protein